MKNRRGRRGLRALVGCDDWADLLVVHSGNRFPIGLTGQSGKAILDKKSKDNFFLANLDSRLSPGDLVTGSRRVEAQLSSAP